MEWVLLRLRSQQIYAATDVGVVFVCKIVFFHFFYAFIDNHRFIAGRFGSPQMIHTSRLYDFPAAWHAHYRHYRRAVAVGRAAGEVCLRIHAGELLPFGSHRSFLAFFAEFDHDLYHIKRFVSCIIGGRLHDTVDWRTYTAELRDEWDHATGEYEVEVRERKAGAVWASGTALDACTGSEVPWITAKNDALAIKYQTNTACFTLLTRAQQDAFKSLTGEEREVKARELRYAYCSGAKYPYPLLWEPGTRRPEDWRSRIAT